MGTKETTPAREAFQIGKLVVISIASRGIQTSISGDEAHTDQKLFWLFNDEYIIGLVVGVLDHPDFPDSLLWKFLTVEGIAHIWSEDIAEDDLSVVPLTASIGEWLKENCTYDYDTGKHTLAKELAANETYSQLLKNPACNVTCNWKIEQWTTTGT